MRNLNFSISNKNEERGMKQDSGLTTTSIIIYVIAMMIGNFQRRNRKGYQERV